MILKTRVKICGIRTLEDALFATSCGADALGFVFGASKRLILPVEARKIIRELPPFVVTIGIFMDADLKEVQEILDWTGVDGVQLHGSESPEYCHQIRKRIIKRIKVNEDDTSGSLISKIKKYDVSAYLLDPGEGSGKTFNWIIASDLGVRLIIAGGLNPENVKRVVKLLRPYGVDVSSGVEKIHGIKDHEKIKKFIREVR